MRLSLALVFVAPGAAAVTIAVVSVDKGHTQLKVEQKVLDHPAPVRQRATALCGCQLDNPQIVKPSDAAS